jgi:uncharacterized repeat protein (TIGR01451 family)
MNAKDRIVFPAAAFALAVAAIAVGQTPPLDVTAQSDSCINRDGTGPLTCTADCLASEGCENSQIQVCSNEQIEVGTGGTFEKTTCSSPSAPFGAKLTIGTIPAGGTASAFFGGVPSSLVGTTVIFQVSATANSGPPATISLTVPVCTASGPSLQITKSGPETVRRTDLITFSISVTNTGTAPTDGAWGITDPLPATCTKSTVQYGKDEPTDCQLAAANGTATVSCPDVLQPGQTESFVVICTAETVGNFQNKATVHGGGAPDAASETVNFKVNTDREDPFRLSERFLRFFSVAPR